MATFSRHQASISNVGSYQVSGYPYISGAIATDSLSHQAANAEFHFIFPRVAKSVTVIFASGTAGNADAGNSTAGLRVHFHSTGAVGDAVGDITATNGTGLDSIADGTRCTSAVLKGRHFVELNAVDESITFDVRCKEIFISRADCKDDGTATDIEFRVVAELTNIAVSELNDMSGSGLTTDGQALGTDPVSASANQ